MDKICLIFIMVLFMVSCSRNSSIQKDVERMISANWDLCLDSLDFNSVENGQFSIEDSLSFYKKNMSLVVYIDSTQCSECAIKSMHNWFDFLDYTTDRYGNDFRTYFIISPRKSQINNVYFSLKEAILNYPVFVDTTNCFANKNPNLPDNQLLHTFLLDKSGNIVLVGSPMANPKIQEIMFHTLDSILRVK